MKPQLPPDDQRRVAEQQIACLVKERDEPRGEWLLVGEYDDLSNALASAYKSTANECSVWLLSGRDRESFRYWSSTSADLFNSIVIDNIVFLRRTASFVHASDDDDWAASKAGNRFSISVRHSSEEWTTVEFDIDALSTAMLRAQEQCADSCRVEVVRPGRDVQVYWTSEHPDIFESHLLGDPE